MPWISCPCCDEFWCTRHGQHAFECPCPPIEEWNEDPYAMPRPKSDLQKVSFRLGPDTLDALDRIAEVRGLVIPAGRFQGQPDRTEALRWAVEFTEAFTRKPQKR